MELKKNFSESEIKTPLSEFRSAIKIRWPDRISNAELHRICKFEELQRLVKKRKWSWIGHTWKRNIQESATGA